MLNSGPLEFLVLKNESQEIHLVQQLFWVFVSHHLLWFFPFHQLNISIDAFTSDIAVEGLGEVPFNTVPACRAAFLQILQR